MSILFDVIDVVGVILEILVAVSFFDSVSEKKNISKLSELMICIIGIVWQSVLIIGVDMKAVGIIAFISSIIMISLTYNLSWIKRFVFCIMLWALFGVLDTIVGLVYIIILRVPAELLSSNIFYYMQGVLVSKILVFIIIKFIRSASIKSEEKIGRYVFLPLLVFFLSTQLVSYVIAKYTYVHEESEFLLISFVTLLFMIISNVLLFYLFEYQIKLTVAKNQEQMMKQELWYKAEYYKELSKRQHITNKTMHDLKNQLFAIKDLLQNDSQEGINRINGLCEGILSTCTLRFTGIEAVDSLITSKLQLMEENDIKFDNSIYITNKLSIDISEFCVLLGNLLDNAIEANMSVAKDRYINMNIKQQFDYLCINIRNAVSGVVKVEDSMINTTKKHKELHGFGLKSINEIVKKYNGDCHFEQNGDEFEVMLMIKNS